MERELGIKGYSCNERRSEKTENEDTTEEGATGGVPVKKNPIIQFYFYHRILFFIMVLIMFAFFFFLFNTDEKTQHFLHFILLVLHTQKLAQISDRSEERYME